MAGSFWQDLLEAIIGWRPAPKPAPKPLPVPVQPPPPEPLPTALATIAEVESAINRGRGSRPALRDDPVLGAFAGAWAVRMAAGEQLTHGDFEGRSLAMFPAGNYAVAEDIAEAGPDADAVVALWMASPPHRANILGDFTHVGVGFARDSAGNVFWSAIFDKKMW